MITRETLELAAKAAGYEVSFDITCIPFFRRDVPGSPTWNPEHDDGDSARLRTELWIDVEYHRSRVWCLHDVAAVHGIYSDHAGDKHAALRYATLMVAAEIGRRMG